MRDMRMEGGQTKNFAKVLECSNELKELLRLIKESTEEHVPPETNLSLEVSKHCRSLISRLDSYCTLIGVY